MRRRSAMRALLSHYVLNGASCAFGLFLVSAVMQGLFGHAAAAAAVVGVIASIPPDQAAPTRGKAVHMVIAPLIGLPLFLAVQLLRPHPLELGLLLVPATFIGFLGMAWGKRGAGIAMAVVFAMIFSMSTPTASNVGEALQRTGYFALGAAMYVVYSIAANAACNGRYRTQLIADLLFSMAALMRAQARRFAPHSTDAETGAGSVAANSELGELLRRQAALADQIQNTRDLVLESPRTPRRQRMAGMLLAMLEMRDQLVASELDLDQVREHHGHAAVLNDVRQMLLQMAADLTHVADSMLTGRYPVLPTDHNARLATLRLTTQAANETPPLEPGIDASELVRGLAHRLTYLNDGVKELSSLARGDTLPNLTVVRNNWRLFVSPTDWSWRPFLSLWTWRAPALRHAIRAALAVGAGYTIATLLPWGSHDYWILLTIVVVLRGSLAQTLERRDARVAGTVLGSLLAVGLLAAHPPAFVLLLAVTIAQGVAHGFALRRYLITAVAASVLGLVQSHLMYAGTSPTFAFLERVGDTLLGAGLAWAFCYVLPSWERGQLAGLVRRTLLAQARHARMAVGLAALHDIDTQPELAWRLARREAYDSLSALVLATERSLSEPRAVQPPVALLERLQAHGYQLLAQLSAAKSMLLLRRDQLNLVEIEVPLLNAGQRIERTLTDSSAEAANVPRDLAAAAAAPIETLPDPFENDISPWLLRRLSLAVNLAGQLRQDADQVIGELSKRS
ncbi:FUSC family protein [bacterium BD-1]|nr:FUSC family protein [Ottowia caeni]